MKKLDLERPGSEIIKKKFMLNSAEHEIFSAHKYKNFKKFSIFQAKTSIDHYFFCSKMLKCQQLFANNCSHFNIYEQKKFQAGMS